MPSTIRILIRKRGKSRSYEVSYTHGSSLEAYPDTYTPQAETTAFDPAMKEAKKLANDFNKRGHPVRLKINGCRESLDGNFFFDDGKFVKMNPTRRA